MPIVDKISTPLPVPSGTPSSPNAFVELDFGTDTDQLILCKWCIDKTSIQKRNPLHINGTYDPCDICGYDPKTRTGGHYAMKGKDK